MQHVASDVNGYNTCFLLSLSFINLAQFPTRGDAFRDLASVNFPDVFSVYKHVPIGLSDRITLTLHPKFYQKMQFRNSTHILTRSLTRTRVCSKVNLNMLREMVDSNDSAFYFMIDHNIMNTRLITLTFAMISVPPLWHGWSDLTDFLLPN